MDATPGSDSLEFTPALAMQAVNATLLLAEQPHRCGVGPTRAARIEARGGRA